MFNLCRGRFWLRSLRRLLFRATACGLISSLTARHPPGPIWAVSSQSSLWLICASAQEFLIRNLAKASEPTLRDKYLQSFPRLERQIGVCLVFHPHSNPFFPHTFPFRTIPFFRFHLTIHHFTYTQFLFLHFTLARKQNLTNIRKENFKPNITKRNIFPNIPSCRGVSNLVTGSKTSLCQNSISYCGEKRSKIWPIRFRRHAFLQQ